MTTLNLTVPLRVFGANKLEVSWVKPVLFKKKLWCNIHTLFNFDIALACSCIIRIYCKYLFVWVYIAIKTVTKLFIVSDSWDANRIKPIVKIILLSISTTYATNRFASHVCTIFFVHNLGNLIVKALLARLFHLRAKLDNSAS